MKIRLPTELFTGAMEPICHFELYGGPALNTLPGSDVEARAWMHRSQGSSDDAAKLVLTMSAEDVGNTIPKDDVTNAAIDDGFKRWSSGWMFDRYVPGSAYDRQSSQRWDLCNPGALRLHQGRGTVDHSFRRGVREFDRPLPALQSLLQR